MGRFLPTDLPNYVTSRREGRGISPRMDAGLRQRFLDEVVHPYNEEKKVKNKADWNDLALELLDSPPVETFHVIIADEAQDFSANQLRAFQRIYPRGCKWAEAGITINRSFRLKENHRNTRQICRFAAPLLNGIEVGDDGTIPDLSGCKRDGPVPVLLEGKFSGQTKYALDYIARDVDLSKESVAFLHPKGGKKNPLRFSTRREGIGSAISNLSYQTQTRDSSTSI